MCLGWLIFCTDRVQIPELWGNSVFISLFLYLNISPLKNEKSLENQGFSDCRQVEIRLGFFLGAPDVDNNLVVKVHYALGSRKH